MNFQSQPVVELMDHMGSDNRVCQMAKVFAPDKINKYIWAEGEVPGIINYMMEHRHGSPFEHVVMTFYVECPIAICREFERHRIGFSFQDEISLNVESGRYSELADTFWIPGDRRAMKKAAHFKHSRPKFGEDAELNSIAREALTTAYSEAWEHYRGMLACDIPREVARMCLPVGIYTRLYVTCNVRAVCHFLSLRTQSEWAKIVSYPQQEIQDVARHIEEHFAAKFPICHEAFTKHGRIGP